MNKAKLVREHLLNIGHIDSWEAIQLYGETRLAAIICNLREKGWNIESVWKEATDRNGDTCRWVQYVYKGEEDD